MLVAADFTASTPLSPSSLPAVLRALGAAGQQLQALQAALAATAAAADPGQQVAGIAAAWGGFVSAYNGSQVGRLRFGPPCAELRWEHARPAPLWGHRFALAHGVPAGRT